MYLTRRVAQHPGHSINPLGPHVRVLDLGIGPASSPMRVQELVLNVHRPHRRDTVRLQYANNFVHRAHGGPSRHVLVQFPPVGHTAGSAGEAGAGAPVRVSQRAAKALPFLFRGHGDGYPLILSGARVVVVCQAGFQLGFINRTVQIIHVLGQRIAELDTIMGRLSTGVKGVPHRIIHSCTGIVDKSLRIPIAQPVKYRILCYGLRKPGSC